MKALKTLEKITDGVCNVLTALSAIALALLTLDVFVQIVVRSIGIPMSISVELTQLLFPWTVCLAMIRIARKSENTVLELLFEKFKGVGRHAAVIFIDVVMIYFSIFMTISSYQLCAALYTDQMQLLHISKIWLYGPMVIAFAGITLMVFFNLVEYICLKVAKIGGEEE